MAHDKAMLKAKDLPNFQEWLNNNGFVWRKGNGEWELMQVKLPIGWGAVCTNKNGVVSTPQELREMLGYFNRGKEWPHKPLKVVSISDHRRSTEVVDIDLRDDFAIAALQGICGNDAALVRFREAAENRMVSEESLLATSAYAIADAMLAARTK